jgi:trehalose-6-phosphate hydrolase
MRKQWWHNAVIYQIYPKSFFDSNNDGIGDLAGISEKLPLIKKNLDIDAVWISPFYESPMKDNGYDVSNYFKVNEIFGTDKDLTHLIDVCNKIKVKLIIDVVLNHTSDQHEWFKKALMGEKKYINYYNFYKDIPNNWKSVFGGGAWSFCESLNMYYLHMFDKTQPDLNWDCEDLVNEVCEILVYWIKKGVSGFRLDVIGMIGKEVKSGELYTSKVHTRLQRLRTRTWKKHGFLTVGETGGDSEMAIRFTKPQSKQLSQTFTYDHMNVDDGSFGKWNTKEFDLLKLARIHNEWQTQININNGWLTNYFENHDQPRVISRWGNDKENREYCSSLFATMLLISKGTSYIYQGQEIGMTNFKCTDVSQYDDVEIKNTYKHDILDKKLIERDVFLYSCNKRARDNSRTTYQWDNSKHGGFSNIKPWFITNENYEEINFMKDLLSGKSIINFFSKLIKLRKEKWVTKCLIYGKYEQKLVTEKILCYSYTYKNNTITIYLNFSNEATNIETTGDVIFNNYKNKDNKMMFPWQAIVTKNRSS